MTIDKEQLPADQDRQQQEADDAYEAGYSGQEPEIKEPEKVSTDDDAKPESKAIEGEADEFTQDEWAGVPESVRKRVEELEKIPTRLRNIEGHIGGLKSTLNHLSTKTANAAAQSKGVASPSQEKVAAAIEDAEEWAKLKEEYPEWMDGFDKQMAVYEKRILQKVPSVNPDEIRSALGQELRQEYAQDSRSLREIIRLDTKYPDWEDDIKKPEFHAFALDGGPPVEEYLENVQLAKTSPAEAEAVLNEWIRQYPNWWSDKGARLQSDSAKDSIVLLDKYNESRTSKTPAPSRQNSQQRLAAATTPKGTPRLPQAGLTDDDAYERGYKRA